MKNRIWGVVKSILGEKHYEIFRALYNLGYMPNLDNPQTFNEKVMHRKLYHNMDHLIELADKYEVRQFVSDRIGDAHLNKLYFIGSNPSDIPWNDLPRQFVLKTTHGGGGEGNVFVFDKNTANIRHVKKALERKLQDRFGFWTNEPWYLKIPRRFIIEELMLDENAEVPKDYKFLCFHGKCHYIQVDAGRFTNHSRSFYDTSWNYQEFAVMYPKGKYVEKPANLNEMIHIAEKLAQDFDFVRVDLYSLNGTVRFGELTFTPSSGWGKFSLPKMDRMFGDLWHMKKQPLLIASHENSINMPNIPVFDVLSTGSR